MVRPCVARGFRRAGVSGLASMYSAFAWSCHAPGHHGYQRARDLINGQASSGHQGHQCSHAPGRPYPPFRLITGSPEAVTRLRTGSPEAVARLRFPQIVACGFPAPRSSAVDSQHCFRCYLFKFRCHGQLIFSLNRRPCLPLNGAHVAQEQFNYR